MDPGNTIKQYKLLETLGSGGMGTVYLAEDTKLGRRAALKFLAPEFASDATHLDRFVREARSASSLNHPNICTIYEIDVESGSPFIAMEYVAGESVSSLIARGRRSVRETLDIAVQTSEALLEAHSNGLIHRDVKPSNLIVTPRGRVKVLDFGLAKQVPQPGNDRVGLSITRPGMILGTASYMSPEQARGLDLDARSDIWSLGVSLFEMLTGKLPYSGETVADTFAAILTGDSPSIRELVPNVDTDIEQLINKMLSKRPADRFSSCAELLNSLRELQNQFEKRASAASDGSASGDERTQVFANETTEVAPRQLTGEDIRDRGLRPNNLSRVLNPIVGRENEIKSVVQLIRQGDVRLATLTGIGGTGKTRLARAVAEEALADFADGVFFIELSAIADPDLIFSAIAKPLGIEDGGSRSLFEMLIERLADKEILFVLDNFEQILSGASKILAVLEATERVKILVTSRSLLRLSFEHEFAVPPLETPLDESNSYEVIRSSASIRLFEARARTAKPGFSVTPENAAAIAKICSQLDGLPLALELAAARIRILSPEAMVERLSDRPKLLSGGGRDLPDRHRTIRDMISWSYDLLSPHEQIFFRRLAVFAGTFAIDAAESICGGKIPADDDWNVLDAISSLAEQSLIVERTTTSGEIRFRMLGVVRDEALELLKNSGELAELEAAHAEYFASSAERSEPKIQTASPGEIFTLFELEHDNLRAALTWSFANSPATAIRLAVALRNFWLLHGHLTEGFGWLSTATKYAEDHANPEQRFKLYSGLGLTARFRGDHEVSRAAYEAGLKSCIVSGDKMGIAATNRGLGLVAMQQNDFDTARSHFDKGLDISRELKDGYGVAMSLSFLGDLCRVERQYDLALPMFEEASVLFRELDRKVALGDSLNNLGTVRFISGDRYGAGKAFAEAAEIASEIGNKITLSHSLDGFGAICAADASPELSAKLAGAAESIRSKIGYKNEPAELAFRDEYLARLKDVLQFEQLNQYFDAGAASELDELLQMAVNKATQKVADA